VIDPVDIDHSMFTVYSMAKSELAQRAALDPPVNPAGTLVARGAVEDNEMSAAVQRGLRSGANEFLEFGRHESGIGHFHANLVERLDQLA
jgi:hypothetical protein